MSVENGKVCCNCRRCKRIHDDKYDVVFCRCEVMQVYLNYAEVMTLWCKHWAKERKENDRK